MDRVQKGIANLHECEKCGRIFEKEGHETICGSCADPKQAENEKKKLLKSKYLKIKSHKI